MAAAAENASVLATVSLHPNEAPRILSNGGRAALDAAYAEIHHDEFGLAPIEARSYWGSVWKRGRR